MARQGKIARLPLALREALNTRLEGGESAGKILPWLNALPETLAVLEEDFEGLRVSEQNLSEWRKGGFVEWQGRRDRLNHTKDLANEAVRLARANGGSLAEGSAAIAAGRILEVLEACDGKMEMPELLKAVQGITSLASIDAARGKMSLEKEKLKRKDQQIALEQKKFQRTTCELFLKWREDKRAEEAVLGEGTNTEKIEKLGQLMFGEDWKPNEHH
jgi:hypothetical protein